MTGTDPPYAHLLKRRPVQQRSRVRVEAILDATAALLADGDLDGVTMRAVADRAGVPTATIYQFFADKQTLLQALSVRYVAATLDTLAAALTRDGAGDWRSDLVAVVDDYADMIRRASAMRVLWLSDVLDRATMSLAEAADDEIARRLATHLQARAGVEPDDAQTVGWRTLVGVISALLKRAFILDPDGAPEVLTETRRVAVLYAGALLDSDRARDSAGADPTASQGLP